MEPYRGKPLITGMPDSPHTFNVLLMFWTIAAGNNLPGNSLIHASLVYFYFSKAYKKISNEIPIISLLLNDTFTRSLGTGKATFKEQA